MKQQDWTEQLRERLADHEEAVPEGLWADIERRIATAKPARRVVLRRWIAAAAACALVLVGVWQWAGKSEQTTVDQANGQQTAMNGQQTINAGEQTATSGAATPLPSRGGVSEGRGGVSNSLRVGKSQTPPPATPLEGRGGATQGEATNSGQTAIAQNSESVIAQTQDSQGSSEGKSQTPPPAPPLEGRGAATGRQPAVGNAATDVHLSRHEAKSGASLSLHATNLMAYEGTTSSTPMQMAPAYMGDASRTLARTAPVYLSNHEELAEHHMPLTVGLSLRLPLSGHWWMTTGVNYSRVSSTFTQQLGSVSQTTKQRLHYIGLPLSAGYTFWQTPRLTAYATAGAEAQLNVQAQVDHGHLERDRMQFSLLGSAGLEYRLAPQFSIYAQPGLRYYPDNGSHVQNIFKDRPLQFDLQLGLRYTLK